MIADNVAGEPATAQPFYAEALARAEEYGDDALAAEALRHQGAHGRRAGAIAAEIHRWAEALGLERLATQAERLVRAAE